MNRAYRRAQESWSRQRKPAPAPTVRCGTCGAVGRRRDIECSHDAQARWTPAAREAHKTMLVDGIPHQHVACSACGVTGLIYDDELEICATI